jgi:hypothetical protein
MKQVYKMRYSIYWLFITLNVVLKRFMKRRVFYEAKGIGGKRDVPT